MTVSENAAVAPRRRKAKKDPIAPPAPAAPPSRRELLRLRLPDIIDALKQRRADLCPEGFIDDYVALDWLEWRGGSLHVTVTGGNVCKAMRPKPVF